VYQHIPAALENMWQCVADEVSAKNPQVSVLTVTENVFGVQLIVREQVFVCFCDFYT
jgi:hypothetical protein